MMLSNLVNLLDSTPEPMTSSRIARVLGSPLDPEELAYWIRFSALTYGRHLISKNDIYELLCLCWQPGQKSKPHEHGNSSSAMKVIHGIAQEDLYVKRGEKIHHAASRLVQEGGIVSTTREMIHSIGNPLFSNEGLVTLHLYSPPLGEFKTYDDTETVDLLRDARRNTG